MHVELVEIFRCIAPHRNAWLVASADRTESRVIVEGTLGCPVCDAEYAIRQGVAHFATADSGKRESLPRTVGEPAGVAPIQGEPAVATDPELALRLAALLGATESSMTFALVGASLDLLSSMQSVTPSRFIVIDAEDDANAMQAHARSDAPLAIVRSGGVLPVAEGALHGIYATGNPASYVRSLRPNARLVAPAQQQVPNGITELARDNTLWVGERVPETKTVPESIVQLRRRR